MNYYAHAHLAAARSADPLFALGAMLPDWTRWVGSRLAGVDHPALAAGVHFHHATDAAFHAGARFGALLRDAVDRLRAAGLPRGPARGAAHVGIELLLDAALVAHPCGHAPYLAALAAAPAASPHLAWRRPDAERRYLRVVAHLSRRGVPRADAGELARGIARTLEPRPRLRVPPAALPALAAWVREAEPSVRREAPAILSEIEADLGVSPSAP